MRIEEVNFMLNYMQCTTCKAIVYANNTGTCLGCQSGFSQEKQEDIWKIEDNTSEDNEDKPKKKTMRRWG
jgi:hypothetical protein